MLVSDIINEALADGRTRFAFELLPPLKGDGTRTVFSAIDPLARFDPAYINITSHREDVKYVERPDGLLERRVVRKRPGTVGIAAAIARRYGVEPVPHIICAGRSRYDIEDELIDMDFLGLHNLLALRGDNLKGENSFVPHAQGHQRAAGLVRQISDMNNGIFVDGEVEVCHHSRFCVGVAGYPEKHSEAPNQESCIAYLKEKVEAGAQYVVTQMSFDNSKIFAFIDACRAAGIDVPIIPGIKPISTRTHLTLLPQVFHVDLPQELVQAVEACRDNAAVREVGVEWAISQARELKAAGLPIIHFYTMGKTDNVAKIAEAVF